MLLDRARAAHLEVCARLFDAAAEALSRALDGFADAAGWLSDVSGDAAETARWFATATRGAP